MEPNSGSLLMWVLMFIGISGIITIIGLLSSFTRNKDTGSEVSKQLGIISGISVAIVAVFGFAAYMYFTANTNYLTPFLFVMTFVNMLLSIIAVSTASLNVSYA